MDGTSKTAKARWSSLYGENDTLHDLYDQACQNYPDRPAFSCHGSSITYAKLQKLSRHFATYLQQDLGLKRGDRAAIMLPNILQYPVALFAMVQCGIVVVNINPLNKAEAIEHELVDSGAKAIVVLSHFAAELAQVVAKTSVQHVIVTQVGDMFPCLKRLLIHFVLRYIKRGIPRWHLAKWTPWRSIMQQKINTDTWQSPKLVPQDLLFLQYTSGTTAKPKGVMLTHQNLVVNIAQAKACIMPYLTHEREVVITALPLYHIFSLMANCCLFMTLGGENVLIPNARDISGLIKTLRQTAFTCFTGVHTLFLALLNHKQFSGVNFQHLTLTVGGGMAVGKEVAERWHRVTGSFLSQAYGMTETSPAISIHLDSTIGFNGSVGRAFPGTSISIRDKKGKVLGIDEKGEVWVSGPQVMRGYWQNPSATKKILVNDFLRTGDVGFLDKQKQLYLVDRLKDLIIVSGFNIAPLEVEEVLMQHADIAEASVIGVPDSAQGECMIACIVLAGSKKVRAKTLADFCAKKLVAYKVPRRFVFFQDLPKTALGKVKKALLRQQYADKEVRYVKLSTRNRVFDYTHGKR